MLACSFDFLVVQHGSVPAVCVLDEEVSLLSANLKTPSWKKSTVR
jgi:hypothetical protein